jgi:chemotaxis protein methyltransferase CheR
MGANRTVFPRTEQAEPLTAENYTFIERYIHQETGIALGNDKAYLLETRLVPVLRDEGMTSLNELCAKLRRGVPEAFRRRIAECLTTHETSFFRDPAVFDALRNHLIPEIAAQRTATRTLRIWSAACSSGQEPYTLAMLLLEAGYQDWKVEILATDFSSRILARAAEGRFLQIEINRGTPAPLLVKYFQRAGLDWQIKDEVKRLIRFTTFDLRQPMTGRGPFDFVLCRNVLIYFDLETRRKIIASLKSTLAPGGYLLLGASETTFQMETGLTRKMVGNVAAFQNPAAGVNR